MSGNEERRMTWVMEFHEYIENLEDSVISFRGIRANSKEEALEKAHSIIDNWNILYSEDEDTPDYILIVVSAITDNTSFIVSDEDIRHEAELAERDLNDRDD